MALMFVLRTITGLGEASVFLGQTYLASLTSVDTRTEVFAMCELGTAAGLAGGPVLTSLANTTGSIWLVSFLALCLLLFMLLAFPSSAELGAKSIRAAEEAHPCWRSDPDMSQTKWVAACVASAGASTRVVLRLVWESSAVLVLSAHFCLGFEITGYLIAAVMGIYLVSQAIFLRLCKGLEDHQLIKRCEVMEIVGLLLMLRWPEDVDEAAEMDVKDTLPAMRRIALFVLASSITYTGNCLTAAPLNSWSTKHGPRKACVLLYNNVMVQVGSFGGAYMSRMFTSSDPHQNILVILMLPVVISQVVLSEVGFRATKSSGCQVP